MVGFGLDIICHISGHHCTGFAPCSGMDASQKQPGSVLGRRPLPSDSSAGVCSMEHALTRPALAPIAGALSFAVSFSYRDQPAISFSLRSVLQNVGLTAASLFYASSVFKRWQRNRSSSATVLAGIACLL